MKAPTALHPVVRSRRVQFDFGLRSMAMAAPATLLVGALTWPLWFSSSSFAGQWTLELWFMWKQSLTIGAGHLPSLFLNYPRGVFYPQFAFSAGTLDALTGALSVLLGNTPIATYVLTYLLAFAAAYGGWYWIARQAGLGRWQGQVPGLVFITSSYYLTLIYARGDWPEFVAVSMIPLMISAGLSILRANRLRMWPALALASSCTLFVGSHVLTLVWGSTTVVLVWLAIVICVPRARREMSRRGLARLAGVAVPALLVSAWFMVPAAAYEAGTWIASQSFSGMSSLLRSAMPLVSTQHIFTLSRSTASPPNAGFALSLPMLAMAWALVGLALVLTAGLHGIWARILLVCASFTTLMIVLMTHAGLILTLPRYYATLQYSYRLESYVLLGLSGTLLSLLVLAQGEVHGLRSWTHWALPPVLVVALTGAIQQAAAYPHTADRHAVFAAWSQPPATAEAASYVATSSQAASSRALSPIGVFQEYVDVHQPIMDGSDTHRPILEGVNVYPPSLNGSFEQLAFVHFDITSPQGDRISTESHLHPGELVNSNLFGSPSFTHVTGARVVGINARDGADVLEVAPASRSSGGGGASAATGAISVAPSGSLPIVLGRVLTICAVIALILQFGLLAIRHRKHAT